MHGQTRMHRQHYNKQMHCQMKMHRQHYQCQMHCQLRMYRQHYQMGMQFQMRMCGQLIASEILAATAAVISLASLYNSLRV